MIDAKQIRAARALLDWTQEVLAEKSGVARATIKNVESGITFPRLETANALQSTLEKGGAEFLSGFGVRMRDSMVEVHEGKDSTVKILDDVYETLKNTGGIVRIAHVSETQFIEQTNMPVLQAHLDRLAEAGIKERMLIHRAEKNLVAPLEAYRYMPDEHFSAYPLYIYSTKIALVSWVQPQKAIIINDERFADSARKMFDFIWERTEMPGRQPKKQQ